MLKGETQDSFKPPQPLRPLRLTLGRFMDPFQILKAYSCGTCLSGWYQPTPYPKLVKLWQQPLCPHQQPLTQPLQSLVALQSRPMYFNVPKTLLRLEHWSSAATTDLWTWKPKLILLPHCFSASTASEDHPREVSERSLKSPSIRALLLWITELNTSLFWRMHAMAKYNAEEEIRSTIRRQKCLV